jgi:hypothetical protein
MTWLVVPFLQYEIFRPILKNNLITAPGEEEFSNLFEFNIPFSEIEHGPGNMQLTWLVVPFLQYEIFRPILKKREEILANQAEREVY